MASSHHPNPSRRRFPATILLLATAILLVFGIRSTSADVVNSSARNPSEAVPSNVGSIGEYLGNSGNASLTLYLPLFGIHVLEDRGQLASGQDLRGVSVISVDRPGPGDDAGIRAQHVRVTRAVAEAGESVLVFGAMLLFPPAVLAIPYIPQVGGATANDVIVAIDADRTRNINELETCLRNAKAGETIYLSIIRDGRREQLRLVAPAILKPGAPTSRPFLSE